MLPGRDHGTPAEPQPVSVPDWATYRRQADQSNFDPTLGPARSPGRGQRQLRHGDRARGGDRAGRRRPARPRRTSRARSSDRRLGRRAATTARSPLSTPAGSRAGRPARRRSEQRHPRGRPAERRRRHVGQVLAATPTAHGAPRRLWPTPGAVPHLRLIAMRGNGFRARRALRTRPPARPGLVQLTDVTPTILEQLGVAVPETLGGSPLVRQPGSPTGVAERRRGCSTTTRRPRRSTPPSPRFFTGLVVGPAAALRLRRPRAAPALERRDRARAHLCAPYAGSPCSSPPCRSRPSWPTSCRGGAAGTRS